MKTNKRSETMLSSDISVTDYQELEKSKDKKKIAQFIKKRFEERYINPFENNLNKNGFIMMAASCLMIESLESFWQGWTKSPNSALAFCQFFERNPYFDAIRGFSQEFYTNIRCGIMHQGETTGGWHIRRDLKELFEDSSKTIDATKFIENINKVLDDYCNTLQNDDWDGEVWKKFRKKMKAICKNAQPKA